MYIYYLYDRYGRKLGWYPASPNNIQLSFSYVGEIVPPAPTPPQGLQITNAPPPPPPYGQPPHLNGGAYRMSSIIRYTVAFHGIQALVATTDS